MMTMADPYTASSGSKDGITTCKNTQEGDMRLTAADTHCNSTDERLDSAYWLSVERQYDNKRTSPPKSPLDEAIDGEEIANSVRKDLSAEYISPLMAPPPLHTLNDTSLQANNATHLMSMSSYDTNSMTYSQAHGIIQSTSSNNAKNNNQNKQSVIQKYRTFLQQNQLSIDLLENVMERFFYGYLFKQENDHHSSSGISTELYYAIWNSIRWLNDVVLVGWGEGMGFTIGKRDEWLSPNNGGPSSERKGNRVSLSDSILLRLNTAVPILRAVLTATTCIYPAMEAWSRRSTIHSSRPLLDNGENNSIRQSRAAQVSYRLERIKFVARLALLSISWWAQQQRRRQQKDDDNNQQKKERIPILLKRGGELDPYEELVPLQEAEDEAKIVQYVGRRTGRRSIAARTSSTTPSSSSSSQLSSFVSSSISNVTILIKRIAKLLSSKHRILYVYAVGELLHILRPLYWSHAETRQYQKQRRSPSIPQKQSSLNSSYSFGIWKAYFISLMMDLISDKLLQLSDGGDTTSSTSSEAHRRGSLFGSRGSIGGRQSSSVSSPSAEQAKHEELEWRRSRHSLYLLRSPMYDTVTQPVATLLGRVVSMIPSFGLGQWAAEYVLDMMSYWNENHFMLES